MDLISGDFLICPHCSNESEETVDELKFNSGFGHSNADICECGECGKEIKIIQLDSENFLIEKEDEEEYDNFGDEEDD